MIGQINQVSGKFGLFVFLPKLTKLAENLDFFFLLREALRSTPSAVPCLSYHTGIPLSERSAAARATLLERRLVFLFSFFLATINAKVVAIGQLFFQEL